MNTTIGNTTTVRLLEEHEGTIEQVMKRHRLKRSDAIRALMSLGCDLYTDLERIGIPQTIAIFDGIKGSLTAKSVSEGSTDLIKST